MTTEHQVLSLRPHGSPRPQRRSGRRLPFEATVRVVQPTVGRGVTLNASERGLRVAVDCPLVAGEMVMLVVRVAGVPEELVRGRVAWARDAGDGCIAGIERVGLH